MSEQSSSDDFSGLAFGLGGTHGDSVSSYEVQKLPAQAVLANAPWLAIVGWQQISSEQHQWLLEKIGHEGDRFDPDTGVVLTASRTEGHISERIWGYSLTVPVLREITEAEITTYWVPEGEQWCNGMCLRASDVGVGVPGDPVAHPTCPAHGDFMNGAPQ